MTRLSVWFFENEFGAAHLVSPRKYETPKMTLEKMVPAGDDTASSQCLVFAMMRKCNMKHLKNNRKYEEMAPPSSSIQTIVPRQRGPPFDIKHFSCMIDIWLVSGRVGETIFTDAAVFFLAPHNREKV